MSLFPRNHQRPLQFITLAMMWFALAMFVVYFLAVIVKGWGAREAEIEFEEQCWVRNGQVVNRQNRGLLCIHNDAIIKW